MKQVIAFQQYTDTGLVTVVNPAAVVAQADERIAAMIERGSLDPAERGKSGLVRCPACHGRGYTGEGRASAWCQGCRYGFIRQEDMGLCPTCDGAEVVAPARGVSTHGDRYSHRGMPCPTCQGSDAWLTSAMGRAGVPRKYRALTLEGWISRQGAEAPPKMREAYGFARLMAGESLAAETSRPGLFLMGATGRGKSGLAAATMRAILAAHDGGAGWSVPWDRAARWISWPTYCDQLIELRDRAGTSAMNDRIRHDAGAEILVIDDLAADDQNGSDFRRRRIWELMEHRHNKPTIVTAMYEHEDLAGRIGEANVSRIIEVCNSVRLDGRDMRQPDGGHH